jgi:hypothetical protein
MRGKFLVECYLGPMSQSECRKERSDRVGYDDDQLKHIGPQVV